MNEQINLSEEMRIYFNITADNFLSIFANTPIALIKEKIIDSLIDVFIAAGRAKGNACERALGRYVKQLAYHNDPFEFGRIEEIIKTDIEGLDKQ